VDTQLLLLLCTDKEAGADGSDLPEAEPKMADPIPPVPAEASIDIDEAATDEAENDSTAADKKQMIQEFQFDIMRQVGHNIHFESCAINDNCTVISHQSSVISHTGHSLHACLPDRALVCTGV
jgi:hypothetical protein